MDSNIKPFTNKYKWEGINYPSKIDDLYIKEKDICPAYASEINSNREKQISFLMIPNEEKVGWRYLALKKNCIIKRNT